MRIVQASLWPLVLPFVEGFAHSLAARAEADGVVVRLEAEGGQVGFGEGAPRPYVTGESREAMLGELRRVLPRLVGQPLLAWGPAEAMAGAAEALGPVGAAGVRGGGAARAALELALLDLWGQVHGASLGQLLPPRREALVYSGVLTSGSLDKAQQLARQFRMAGLRQVKVKVGADLEGDLARLQALREALGPEAELRVDANAAWDLPTALRHVEALAEVGVVSVEEPLSRERLADWVALQAASPIPLVADEAAVTPEEVRALGEAKACGVINLRASKAGGLGPAWAMAQAAEAVGLQVQLGAQVGETAILSAAGRHLGCALPALRCAEGSFGTLLLREDVARDPVRFAHGGKGPRLKGPGLGLVVRQEVLARWSAPPESWGA